MRILGIPIPFSAPSVPQTKAQSLTSVSQNRGWWRVFESFSGAWQKNVVVDRNLALSFHAVNACMTLIASDIAKLRIKLVELTPDGVWRETKNPAYTPVLRKPNGFQNRIQFLESWILSKLSRGNTYVLKQRDNRGVVVALYVLDPNRVVPLVATDGSVFYQLQIDYLSGLQESVKVPAREIIHDRYNCLFHPLIGMSALYACGLAAMQGLNIQQNSAHFFGNQSQPGGVLTAPKEISDATAARLKTTWDGNFTGKNAGRIAVLGDGLKYERMALTAEESQLIEQMRWTAEVVASTFHVPPYKIGVGPVPVNTNVQALNVDYLGQALGRLIEDVELCLDEGLVTGETLGTELDTDTLLRMDSVTQMDVLDKADGILTPNEQRARLNLPPVPGGDSVYKQQQDFSLEALAKRDAQANPFASATPKAPVADPANDPAEEQPQLALPPPPKALPARPVSAFKVKTLFAHRRAA